MWFLGRGPERVPSSAPPTARFRETFDQVTTRPRSLLCRGMRSPLATLAHQGSDPTLPHQALGDPTERHAFSKALNRHGDIRRCAAPRPARSGEVGLPLRVRLYHLHPQSDQDRGQDLTQRTRPAGASAGGWGPRLWARLEWGTGWAGT